jgi:hypothetical protein
VVAMPLRGFVCEEIKVKNKNEEVEKKRRMIYIPF